MATLRIIKAMLDLRLLKFIEDHNHGVYNFFETNMASIAIAHMVIWLILW